MTTIAPGHHSGHRTDKPQQGKRQGVSRRAFAFDDDPTEYPDGEPMGRDRTESSIVFHLEPVVIRYQAERGIVCCVGSDNFIYWAKGDNKASVSPDLYILPGLAQTAQPRSFQGSKDEGCWKTWIHGVAPTFALEVKAFKNPRKDELQSPARHDALGTKELIIFDPFILRRRGVRKRFCVQRRNAAGKLVTVLETNEDRVFSEELDAYIVVQGEDAASLLRLGVGPNGDRLLPFESERVEMESRLRQEESRRADEESRLRQEESRLRQEESRLRQEESRLRQEESRRADEAIRVAQEAAQRAVELEAELARLRAGMTEKPKRRSKSEK